MDAMVSEVRQMRELIDIVSLALFKRQSEESWSEKYNFDQIHQVVFASYEPNINRSKLFQLAKQFIETQINEEIERCQMLPVEENRIVRRKRRMSGGDGGLGFSKAPKLRTATPGSTYGSECDRQSRMSVGSKSAFRAESGAQVDVLLHAPWPPRDVVVTVYQAVPDVLAGFSVGSEHGIRCTIDLFSTLKNLHNIEPTHAVVLMSDSNTKDRLLRAVSNLKGKQLRDLLTVPQMESLFPDLRRPEGWLFEYSPVFYARANNRTDWTRALQFMHNARSQSEDHTVAILCDSVLGRFTTQFVLCYCLATGVADNIGHLVHFLKGKNNTLALFDHDLSELSSFVKWLSNNPDTALSVFPGELIAPEEVTQAMAVRDKTDLCKSYSECDRWCRQAYKQSLPEYHRWKWLRMRIEELGLDRPQSSNTDDTDVPESYYHQLCAKNPKANAFQKTTAKAKDAARNQGSAPPKSADPFENDFLIPERRRSFTINL